ncbi:MAG: LLM class flavin-dependent oxidoreductase [Chloroflexi bacterium]|nr:LLM class flavin-dependent oxidoreductase [Chloroflexota bacterium]
MAIGVGLSSRSRLATSVLVQMAAEAERLGYDWIFTNEHGNDALLTAALFGAATRRAAIATGIVNAFLRHPALTAASAVSLADATGGRFVLGLGTGHRLVSEVQLGIAIDQPLARLRECLAIVRGLTTHGQVDFEGRYYRARGIALMLPPPAQPVPIYLAVLGLRAAQAAGELADGVILNFAPPQHVAAAIAAVREGARRAGRPPEAVKIVCYLQTMLAPPGAEGEALRAAQGILAGYGRWEFYRAMFAASGFAREAEALARAAGPEEGMAAVSEALVRSAMVFGTAAECAARVAEYRALGVDVPVVYPNARHARWDEAIRETIAALAPGHR